MNGLVIDVEATGPTVAQYGMIQIGCADLAGNTFIANMRPRDTDLIDPNALNAIGLTEEEIRTWPDPAESMKLFSEWLQDTYKGKRIPSWSDNPAFDWQYINGYLWLYTGGNPLGFSMRRIGDFYAGIQKDVYSASKWKRLRDTKHTHNALDDAKGNVEALQKILDMQ